MQGSPVAIRLVVADAPDRERQLARWQEASGLNLPNLVRILAIGRSGATGMQEIVYMVEEFAEESLGQIIPERALNADETRGMLKPVLVALEYLHDRGFLHGSLRPSHIFAVGDQVKLSSDCLLKPGEVPLADGALDAPELAATGASSATDVWSLGMTLVEVMTQHAPAWDAARMAPPAVSEDMPEPFRTIAQRCLEIDPAKRCNIADIREWLESGTELAKIRKAAPVAAAEASEKTSPKFLYRGLLAIVVAVLAFLVIRSHLMAPNQQETPASAQPATQSAPAQAPPAQPSPQHAPLVEKPANEESAENAPTPKGDVAERATPDVSSSARRSIHGKIKVRVRVNVNADGKVTSASLKESGPSKYFARVAEEAAMRWKFVPAPDGGQSDTRSWTLLFVFRRGGTEMSATRAR